MSGWNRDLRYALRKLRRSPGFTAFALATLALVVAATTLVYSLVDAYVDAHFRNFKIEFETDPALEGRQPNTGARVGWELRF